MPNTEQKYVALYSRLSQEDARQGESLSIQNQKIMLERYAADNGFTPIFHYCDDGWSGGNFNRPSWKNMIADAQNGKISTIIAKDLSRIGRDYLGVGKYIEEIFPEMKVRVLTTDGIYDSAEDSISADIIPFLNAANDQLLRQTSRKIRAVKRSDVRSGKRSGTRAPYGYLKVPHGTHIVPDPDTAPIVRRIFRMCIEGKNCTEIARTLESEKIYMPTYWEFVRNGRKFYHFQEENPYAWNAGSIKRILTSVNYIGNSFCMQSTTFSYKNKTRVRIPKEDWVLIEGDHEAIIDRETWEIVQRLSKNKYTLDSMGEQGVLSGMMVCSNCGAKLHISRCRKNSVKKYSYVCTNYRKYDRSTKEKICTRHAVNNEILYSIALEEIRRVTSFARNREREFAEYINQKSAKESKKILKQMQKDFDKKSKRAAELDKLFKKVYEDFALERIDENQFNKLSKNYLEEQKTVEIEAEILKNEIEKLQSETANSDRFIALAKKYTDIQELTPEIVHTFIEKIVVYDREKEAGTTAYKQRLDFYFTHVGYVGSEDSEKFKMQRVYRPDEQKLWEREEREQA
jgi:DNA invertase Pin-like site-specific DNA recombinase